MADAKTATMADLNIPVLDGYVLIAEAADMLGVSKQHAYRLVRSGELTSVRRLGTSQFYVIEVSEVNKRIEELAARRAERDTAKK